MRIDQSFRVSELTEIELYCIPNAIDKITCDKLIDCIDKNCNRSTVTNGAKKTIDAVRTSSTCHLEKIPDYKSIVKYFQSTILDYTGFPYDNSEPLQGQRYLIGEFYRRHTDFFTPNTKTFREFTVKGGQRTWTTMVYLNDVISGGETYFPIVNYGIMPTTGTMLIWNNLGSNNKENYSSLHEALPPQSNSKYVVTQWFRQNTYR